MSGMIAVREFTTAQDMVAHAREVARRARLRDMGGSPAANFYKPPPKPVVHEAVDMKPQPESRKKLIDFWREFEEPPVELIAVSIVPSVPFVVRCAAQFFGIPLDELRSPRRTVAHVNARHAAFWAAREITGASMPRIAAMSGRGDHTTVLHGLREMEKRRAADEAWRATTDDFMAFVRWCHSIALNLEGRSQ